jgi:hypothetical protein
MDDVDKLHFQRSLLQTADRLESVPLAKRTIVFNSMIDKAFEHDGATRARMLHFNACLVTELRRRDVGV